MRTWTQGPPLPLATRFAGGTVVGNYLYYFGGYTESNDISNRLFVYDISNNVWKELDEMPSGRAYGGVVGVGSKIYCMGGRDSQFSIGAYNSSKTLDIYDTSTNTWAIGSDMLETVEDFGCTAVNNKIYCIGGSRYSAGVSIMPDKGIVQIYDIDSDSWSYGNEYHEGFAANTSTSVGNKIYNVGMAIVGKGKIDTLLVYNTIDNTWSTASSMPSQRYNMKSIKIENKVYCMGGLSGSASAEPADSIYVYDPESDEWSEEFDTELPPIIHHVCAANKGKAFLVGGMVYKDGMPKISDKFYISQVSEEPEEIDIYLLLELEESKSLLATLLPSNTRPEDVIWNSSDSNIALVNENGVVTGISLGESKITVVTNDGKFSAAIMVEVLPIEDTELRLSIHLKEGESCKLMAKFKSTKEDAQPVWSSEDDTVASIGQNGIVTANSVGDVCIAAAVDAIEEKIHVIVTQ